MTDIQLLLLGIIGWIVLAICGAILWSMFAHAFLKDESDDER